MDDRGKLASLKDKVFLLISRGKLLKIDNSDEEMQKIQISNLAKESISDIERYQEYGLENYPIITNAETITLFINGNRNANKAINIKINNRKLRPTDLSSGDVCLYCIDNNNTNENRIWLKPKNNEIEIKTYDGHDIKINNSGIVVDDGVNGHNITLDNSGWSVTDGVNSGNKITASNSGIKIDCKNSNTYEMVAGEVKINGTNLEVLQ
jgi:phage gp45-like